MDGFVLDYVNTFRSEIGRLPEHDEYAQIMSVYTPAQVPVISTIARGFATFDPLVLRGALADVHEPELAGQIAKDSRPRTQTVAGYDLTFPR